MCSLVEHCFCSRCGWEELRLVCQALRSNHPIRGEIKGAGVGRGTSASYRAPRKMMEIPAGHNWFIVVDCTSLHRDSYIYEEVVFLLLFFFSVVFLITSPTPLRFQLFLYPLQNADVVCCLIFQDDSNCVFHWPCNSAIWHFEYKFANYLKKRRKKKKPFFFFIKKKSFVYKTTRKTFSAAHKSQDQQLDVTTDANQEEERDRK